MAVAAPVEAHLLSSHGALCPVQAPTDHSHAPRGLSPLVSLCLWSPTYCPSPFLTLSWTSLNVSLSHNHCRHQPIGLSCGTHASPRPPCLHIVTPFLMDPLPFPGSLITPGSPPTSGQHPSASARCRTHPGRKDGSPSEGSFLRKWCCLFQRGEHGSQNLQSPKGKCLRL